MRSRPPSGDTMTSLIRQLSTTASDFEAEFERVRLWSAETDQAIEDRVSAILADVKKRGDDAVLEYTKRFDAVNADSVKGLEITKAELQAALSTITPKQRAALESAAARVRDYHQRQLDAC